MKFEIGKEYCSENGFVYQVILRSNCFVTFTDTFGTHYKRAILTTHNGNEYSKVIDLGCGEYDKVFANHILLRKKGEDNV